MIKAFLLFAEESTNILQWVKKARDKKLSDIKQDD